MSVAMLKRSWLEVKDVFVYRVCRGEGKRLDVYRVCRGEGAQLNVFRNSYIVNEIKVIDDSNKSNILYDIYSYCYIV